MIHYKYIISTVFKFLKMKKNFHNRLVNIFINCYQALKGNIYKNRLVITTQILRHFASHIKTLRHCQNFASLRQKNFFDAIYCGNHSCGILYKILNFKYMKLELIKDVLLNCFCKKSNFGM